jgi:hypothetical protein
MSVLDQWNHKWFGAWREYGPAYELCPHIQEFVIPEVASRYDKVRLREYLTKSQVVASTRRGSFPCPFTGKRNCGSISFRTDGEWLWLDDLPDYIDQFNVAIPSSWLLMIEANGYVPPPPINPSAIEKLDWPPVKR